jgi:hypothetical protein
MDAKKEIICDGSVLELDRFDMANLAYDQNKDFKNPRIAVIAKSGSGKSWVVRDILYYLHDVPCGAIIAPTDKMTQFYDSIFPPSFIHHEYKENIIPRVLQRQRMILEKNEKRKKKHKKPVDPRSILLMDDCMSSKHLWLKDPNMLAIFNEGRHYQITFILTMQYCLGIQPELRSNFDYIFMLGEDFVNNRKKLYEHYAGMFPSRDIFEQVFMQVTDNYGCMVIDNRLRSNDLKKKVFWYKAKNRKDFSVGSRKFNKFHKKYFDKNYGNRQKVLDMSTFISGTKRRKNIIVRKT